MALGQLAVLLLGFCCSAAIAYDKYADAVAKYARWQEKYGSIRSQRNTVRREDIFLPHRPAQVEGKVFTLEDAANVGTAISSHNNEIPSLEELEQSSPDLVRGVRNPDNLEVGLGGAEYVLADAGVPLYKYKKRWPLGYGRRRRRDIPGWTLLDPNTGRPLGGSPGVSAVQRIERRPEGLQNFQFDASQPLGEERLLTELGQQESTYTDYKYYKKYPYTG